MKFRFHSVIHSTHPCEVYIISSQIWSFTWSTNLGSSLSIALTDVTLRRIPKQELLTSTKFSDAPALLFVYLCFRMQHTFASERIAAGVSWPSLFIYSLLAADKNTFSAVGHGDLALRPLAYRVTKRVCPETVL